MPLIARVMASVYALVVALAGASAAVWPDTRAAMVALCVAGLSQLAVWTVLPMARDRMALGPLVGMDAGVGGAPPKALIGLEAGVGVGSIVVSVSASAWFVLPAVTALATAAGLVWARRVHPTPTPLAAMSARPAEVQPTGRTSLEELRVLFPGLYRFDVGLMVLFLILAVLCALAAIAEPLLLILAAFFAAAVACVRIAVWLWFKTTSPAWRRQVEEARRAREAARESHEPEA
jgi:hypothetical protein